MMYTKPLVLLVAAIAAFIVSTEQQQTTNCVGQLDLVFMVDASNSVGDNNFRRQMNGLANVVNSLNVQPNAIRVGLVVFSTGVESYAISGNKAQVLDNIRRAEYLDETTRTDLGLRRAMALFRAAPRDSSVPKLLVLITDGASSIPDETLQAATEAKAQGIDIYAVGITDNININELRLIASSPDKVKIYKNFENIAKDLEDSVQEACVKIIVPTTAPPPVVPSHLCINSGSTVNGYAFVQHPMLCSAYIQCYYNPTTGLHLGVLRHCPLGLHYHPKTRRCDWPERVNCPGDPCIVGCSDYPAANTFRGYWTCEDGRSKGKCCDDFHRFVPGKGCVKSKCYESCSLGKCKYGMCTKRPVWGSPTQFQYKANNPRINAWLPAFCPSNTLNLVDCMCSSDPDHFCTPDFQTSFDTSAPLGQYLTLRGATLGGFGASVGNNKMMHVDLHKNMGNEPLTIKMTFMEGSMVGDDGELLLSSDHNCPKAGGKLKVTFNMHYLVVYLMTADGETARASVPMNGLTNNNTPKDLTISYDNYYLTVSVQAGNVQFIDKEKAPHHVTFPCGLDIGPTFGKPGFTGTVSKLAIYSCTPNKFY